MFNPQIGGVGWVEPQRGHDIYLAEISQGSCGGSGLPLGKPYPRNTARAKFHKPHTTRPSCHTPPITAITMPKAKPKPNTYTTSRVISVLQYFCGLGFKTFLAHLN